MPTGKPKKISWKEKVARPFGMGYQSKGRTVCCKSLLSSEFTIKQPLRELKLYDKLRGDDIATRG